MPLVPRHLRPRQRVAAEARALPADFSRAAAEKSCGARRKNKFAAILAVLCALLWPASVSQGEGVRVRDIAIVYGAQDNQLTGVGLVAGLAGDGDKDQVYTKQAFANMLMRFGLNVPAATLSAKNVALVSVTADIKAFQKEGARMDVTVEALGDAKSLTGGVLLQTPLLGADGKVYAVAQGALSIGGFSAGDGGAGGATVTKNHPNTGQIINGALVQKEIPAQFVNNNLVELLLREPSFGSASRMAVAINEVFTNAAHAVDSSTVQVQMPPGTAGAPVDFIARLQNVELTPDIPARIIINERTGTIVATAAIHISSCAVASGNITINVSSALDVSQPNAFGGGSTVVTPRTTTQVTENKSLLVPLPELPTVEKVASALSALGATPRDMMAIFQAMKQAGALQAELLMR